MLLPPFLAAVFWVGPRYLWGWRASTQLASRTAPSCAEAAEATRAWVAAFSEPSIDSYASTFWHADSRTHARFDALPPMWISSPHMRTYGSASEDGHKTLIDIEFVWQRGLGAPASVGVVADSRAATPAASLAAAAVAAAAPPPCIVYSVGGNAEVAFEVSVLELTSCFVWQFDCTVSPERMAHALAGVRADLLARFTFLPYCVGEDGVVTVLTYGGEPNTRHSTRTALRSIDSIMKELGHKRLDLFKMDAEGAEHSELPAFFAAQPASLLPPQVSIELHDWGTCLNGRCGPSAALAPTLTLFRAGYVLISRRDNLIGNPGCCTELTFALCQAVDETEARGVTAGRQS